jgi:hypothetical protein
MKALVLFAIESGMRRSEMLSMSWREVHFDRGVIALADTKNGQPRWIPLTPSAREILMRQQAARTTRPFPITAREAPPIGETAEVTARIDLRQTVTIDDAHFWSGKMTCFSICLRNGIVTRIKPRSDDRSASPLSPFAHGERQGSVGKRQFALGEI